MNKIKVAVLFGGRSPEHEVSIITGIQIMEALDKDKYYVVPVYITKEGRWIRGDESFLKPQTFIDLDKINTKKSNLAVSYENSGIMSATIFSREKIDVVFPAFHGRYGEDGAVQGLLELSGTPFVGCDVQTSAIGMDKAVSKRIANAIGISTLKDICVQASNRDVKIPLKYPLFVKPIHLGSSIGLAKVHSEKELKEALEIAFFYDTKILIEESLEEAKEVNISILGNNPYETSVCEMPVATGEILSFSDKYTSGKGPSKGMASAKRLIPAPIKEATKKQIENYAKLFFEEIGGQGLARIDFLISKDEKKIYFNEINTLPGSIAFYLWQPVGLSFTKLTDKLISLALERSSNKSRLITTFTSNILQGFKGSKGIKG